METLFPVGPVYPDGFLYFPEFLTEQEETDLSREISNYDLQTFVFQGYEARRKIASFGYDYSFDKKTLSRGTEIPSSFQSLIRKVADKVGLVNPAEFSELLLTEYPVGSVINWHRDAFPFGLIAGISILSDCIFRLRPHDKAKQTRKSIISIPVKRRSLYVISGCARTDWQHSIAPVKSVRYSITLRTLNKGMS